MSNTTIIYRLYQPKDYQALVKMVSLLERHFVATDVSGEHREFLAGEPEKYLEKIFDDLSKMHGQIFVAEKAKEMVGFIEGVVMEKRDLQYHSRRDGWIGLLYVDEKMRRKGIGENLISKMREYFISQGCTTMRLLVGADNTEAIRTYENTGFSAREIEMARKIA